MGLHVPDVAAALGPYRDDRLGGDALVAFWAFEQEHPLVVGNTSAASIGEVLVPRAEVIRSYWRPGWGTGSISRIARGSPTGR